MKTLLNLVAAALAIGSIYFKDQADEISKQVQSAHIIRSTYILLFNSEPTKNTSETEYVNEKESIINQLAGDLAKVVVNENQTSASEDVLKNFNQEKSKILGIYTEITQKPESTLYCVPRYGRGNTAKMCAAETLVSFP